MFDQKSLDTEIQKLEQELKLKKLLKKELSRTPPKHFIDTKFGQGWTKVVRSTTKGFASLHENAELAISNPEQYKKLQIEKEAAKLLDKCKEVSPDDKKAHALAVEAAKMVLELEADGIESLLVLLLDEQVQRLRPPKNAEQAEKIETFLNNMIASVQKDVK